MIPTNHTINSAVFLLCSMSPAAKDGIETESYRQTVDTDEADDHHILESAFANMVRDLQATGLILDIDLDEVFEDDPSLFAFLDFVSYLLPNTLYSHLKTDDKLFACVGHILDGSLGDNETLIQTYLSELAGLDGQDPLVENIADITERYHSSISQTSVFTDYIRNLYNLIKGEKLSIEVDAESHTQYRVQIREFVARFATAVDALDGNPDFEKLVKLQNQLILDLVAPDNFTSYNYLFTVTPDSLPEDLVASYLRRWYHYQVSNKWCSAYYTVRSIRPDPEYVLAMYCFLYAIHPVKEAYQKEVETLFSLFPQQTTKHTIDALY